MRQQMGLDRAASARGLWAMVATPFSSDAAEVDHRSLAALVRRLVSDGATGLVALGVIAEPESLSDAERACVLQTILAAADGTPVLATVMDLDEQARARQLEALAAQGDRRDLVGVMVPVSSADSSVLRRHLQQAHMTTGLPLVVQDYPAATGIAIDVEVLADAVADLPYLQALKCEAAPTFARIHRLAERLPDVELMAGLGGLSLVEDLAAGATSLACGVTRPGQLAAALAAWHADQPNRARALISEISTLIHLETQPRTSIGIRKEHWRRQGVVASAAVRSGRLPYPAFLSPISEWWGYPAEPALVHGPAPAEPSR